MLERNLSAVEKGIRHAPESCVVSDRALESHARDDRAGQAQPDETGEALRATGHRFCALDRSVIQRQHDVRAGERLIARRDE